MQDEPQIWERDGYVVSTDRSLLDVDRIHRYLSEESYWAAGIPRDEILILVAAKDGGAKVSFGDETVAVERGEVLLAPYGVSYTIRTTGPTTI